MSTGSIEQAGLSQTKEPESSASNRRTYLVQSGDVQRKLPPRHICQDLECSRGKSRRRHGSNPFPHTPEHQCEREPSQEKHDIGTPAGVPCPVSAFILIHSTGKATLRTQCLGYHNVYTHFHPHAVWNTLSGVWVPQCLHSILTHCTSRVPCSVPGVSQCLYSNSCGN